MAKYKNKQHSNDISDDEIRIIGYRRTITYQEVSSSVDSEKTSFKHSESFTDINFFDKQPPRHSLKRFNSKDAIEDVPFTEINTSDKRENSDEDIADNLLISSSLESDKKYKQSKNKISVIVISTIISIILIIIGVVLYKIFTDTSEITGNNVAQIIISQTSVNELQPNSFASVENISVNNISLQIITPHNATPRLVLGLENIPDSTAVLVTQAASVSTDNPEEAKIVGAFVINGTPISWGKSKAGFCAIIEDSLYVGSSKNTYLFEKATESHGYFFRQYSIVENGKVAPLRTPDKFQWRAICTTSDQQIKIISACNATPINDFSQALVDFGVNQAILIDSGNSILRYMDCNGKIHNEGEVQFDTPITSFLIWE